MFNKIFSLLDSSQFYRFATITTHLNDIIEAYENAFDKDHDAHIAAYDALIQILEAHKQKIIEAKNGQKN